MLGVARVKTSPICYLAFNVVKTCLQGWAVGRRKVVEEWNVLRVFSKLFLVDLHTAMSFASTSESYRLQKIIVDQLRIEKNVSRIKVSEAANELKSYVEKIQREDPLVTGVPGNQNPFKEKSSCTLIWGCVAQRSSSIMCIKGELECKWDHWTILAALCATFVFFYVSTVDCLWIFPAGILDVITRDFFFQLSKELYLPEGVLMVSTGSKIVGYEHTQTCTAFVFTVTDLI